MILIICVGPLKMDGYFVAELSRNVVEFGTSFEMSQTQICTIIWICETVVERQKMTWRMRELALTVTKNSENIGI